MLAFTGLRQDTLDQWGIDVLYKPTLAALAAEIFRRHFLSVLPSPVRKASQRGTRLTSTGYRGFTLEVSVYDGPSDVRLLAGQSYWGGRVEAYVRGLVEQPVVEWDVVSLYPTAALMQPLPSAQTKWVEVTTLAAVLTHEGFGTFRFRFPGGVAYPCLPCTRPGIDRLLFPRRGETSCTFAEVRAALKMGATIEVVKAFGFQPTAREGFMPAGQAAITT